MKNIELLRRVARDIEELGTTCLFFGGTVVGLHLDELPPNDEERPTTDVDCVPVTVSSWEDMRKLEAQMDAKGWRHSLKKRRRNAYSRIAPCGIPVDLVPSHTLGEQDPVRLGRTVEVELSPGSTVEVLDSASMVAAKLAAFRDRGAADPLMSHDLEDLAMLLSCCSTIETSLATADPRLEAQVRNGLQEFLDDAFVLEVLDGSVPPDIDATRVIARIRRLARVDS